MRIARDRFQQRPDFRAPDGIAAPRDPAARVKGVAADVGAASGAPAA